MEISNKDWLQVGTLAYINIQTQSTINWLTLPLIFYLLEQHTNQQQTLCLFPFCCH